MKRLILFAGILLAVAQLGQALAQGLPKSQPKMLTIYREQVKVGRTAQHNKFEAAYPAALEKSKSPSYYLAMVSLTGPNEVWYVEPQESHASIAEGMKRDEKDPILSAEMDRLALADAEYITSSRVIRASAIAELSVGAFPDLSKVRFFEITTFRIRPGREQQFEEMSKVYATVMKRGAPNAAYRMYRVVAGDRQPTYLVFSSVNAYGEFDQRMSESEAAFKKATAEESAAFSKFHEVAESIESNHYRLDPGQSYVSKETRATDPEFWMPK